MAKNILCVGSHSDDLEIGLGGTAARLFQEGWDIDFLLVCNLARIKDISKRIDEAKEAASILGTNLQIFDLQEGNFRDIPSAELVSRLDEFFSKKPYRKVFIPCYRDSHSDHRFVSEVIFSVCRKNTADLLMMEPPIPSGIMPDPMALNYFVNISDYMETKMRALRCHKSQIEAYGEMWLTAIEARARFLGQKFGWKYAEAFSCVKQLIS